MSQYITVTCRRQAHTKCLVWSTVFYYHLFAIHVYSQTRKKKENTCVKCVHTITFHESADPLQLAKLRYVTRMDDVIDTTNHFGSRVTRIIRKTSFRPRVIFIEFV